MSTTNKIGLKEAYGSDEDVQNVVQCLVSLPLLPPEEIVAAIDDVEMHVLIESSNENQLRQLIRSSDTLNGSRLTTVPSAPKASACTITKAYNISCIIYFALAKSIIKH